MSPDKKEGQQGIPIGREAEKDGSETAMADAEHQAGTRSLPPLRGSRVELNGRVIWVSSAECNREGAQLDRARALEEIIRIEAKRLSGEKARRYEKVGIPRRFRDADIDDERLIGYMSVAEACGSRSTSSTRRPCAA